MSGERKIDPKPMEAARKAILFGTKSKGQRNREEVKGKIENLRWIVGSSSENKKWVESCFKILHEYDSFKAEFADFITSLTQDNIKELENCETPGELNEKLWVICPENLKARMPDIMFKSACNILFNEF